MTDAHSSNAYEAALAPTSARSAAEASIERLRLDGGIFVEAVRATRMPMVVVDPRLPGAPIVFANDAFIQLTGYNMEEVLGQRAHFMNGSETDPEDIKRFGDALEQGRDVELETVQYGKDGKQLVLAVFCRVLFDKQGRANAHFLSYLDVTRRATAERQVRDHAVLADQRLEESQEQYRLIVEGARDYAIFLVDPDGRIEEWYEGAETVFGWTRDEARGELMEMTFVIEDREQGVPRAEREEARRSGSAPNVRWHLRKDGTRVFVEGRTVALFRPDGSLRGFMKIGQDVTEHRRGQQRQATLLAELQHRVRNVLAMVTSVVRRSSSGRVSVDDYRDHLTGRLAAMSRTQVLLTRSAGAGADLETLVRDELLGQGGADGVVSVSGPAVTVAPKAAEVLTLAIHELATNAIKYGALSPAGGRVDVDWNLYDHDTRNWLSLRWVESGVLDVPAAPQPAGFGTELIVRRVPFDLGGRASLEVQPDGVLCTIEFPLVESPSVLQSDDVVGLPSERGVA